MKIALVGIGKIALDQHVPSIAASPDWELAATVSRNASLDDVPHFANFDAMLDQNPDIGVVSLCLPPQPRFDYAARSLAAGRHVMLEKPPGATLGECQTLFDMARKSGKTLFATWHSREAEQVDAARAWLADKVLTSLHVSWKENVRYFHPNQDWVFEPGGLGVFDPGINALSIVTKILPSPLHVTAAKLTFPANRQTPTAADLAFHYEGGAEVTAKFDWLSEGDPDWSIVAITNAGGMVLSEGGAALEINGLSTPAPETAATLKGEYPRLYARMADLVADNACDMDLAPLSCVADAFLLAERVTGPEFYW